MLGRGAGLGGHKLLGDLALAFLKPSWCQVTQGLGPWEGRCEFLVSTLRVKGGSAGNQGMD